MLRSGIGAIGFGMAILLSDVVPPSVPVLPPGPVPAAPDTLIVHVDLGNGIHLFRSPSGREQWTATNSVAIINDADVTVFDSNTRPSTARLIVAEIRKLTPKPVRWLINSHWHMDHWSGNEVYAREFPGVQIVATKQTRDFMRRLVPRYYAQSINVDRIRAALDTMIRTGKKPDGSSFTPEDRRREESELADVVAFRKEMETVTHVLPTVVFTDSMTFWSGSREFRLLDVTGDAAGSTVLYLPKERLLVTGDVLVRQEDGRGAQPWTMNSYAISDWLASLRRLEALDLAIIVPGQGPELRDKEFLRWTIEMYAAIVGQVDSALASGAVTLGEVRQAVRLDPIRVKFTGNDPDLDRRFKQVTDILIGKAWQEAHDGVAARS